MDEKIDRLLALAAANPPQSTAALLDRVLADALAMQPAPPPLTRPASAPARPGLFARIAATLGGAPALAAMCAAVLGIAVGYLNPAVINSLAGGLMDSGTEELFPQVDFLVTEG